MTAPSVVAAVALEDHDDVLKIAWTQASTRNARLVICTVVAVADELAPAQEALGERVRALLPPDAKVELDVRIGERAEGILACAEAHDAQLVVLGPASQRDGLLGRFLKPSLATALTRSASCPILVTRRSSATGRILAATDLGDPTRPVLRAAAEEVARVGGHVYTVHCVAPMPLPATLELAEFAVETTEAVRSELERAALEAGVPVDSLLIETGPAVATILERAKELAVDLIVIGSHGRTGVSRLVLGSVAEAVVRDAPCNVLVVRLSAPERAAA